MGNVWIARNGLHEDRGARDSLENVMLLSKEFSQREGAEEFLKTCVRRALWSCARAPTSCRPRPSQSMHELVESLNVTAKTKAPAFRVLCHLTNVSSGCLFRIYLLLMAYTQAWPACNCHFADIPSSGPIPRVDLSEFPFSVKARCCRTLCCAISPITPLICSSKPKTQFTPPQLLCRTRTVVDGPFV